METPRADSCIEEAAAPAVRRKRPGPATARAPGHKCGLEWPVPLNTFDEHTVVRASRWFAQLSRYHRCRVRHLERVPEGPALLVGNHSGALNPVDGLFLLAYYRHFGYRRPVYVLAHDLLFRLPRFGQLLNRLGVLRASRQQAQRILRSGHKLLVFPGGEQDSLRPFRERRRVVLAQRRGFAHLALAEQVPVVPIVSAGSHETLVVLHRGATMGRWLRLPELMRVEACPLGLAMPWGVMWGPMFALPYVPLPAKVSIAVGEPLLPAAATASATAIYELYNTTERRMQQLMESLYAERRWPVLG